MAEFTLNDLARHLDRQASDLDRADYRSALDAGRKLLAAEVADNLAASRNYDGSPMKPLKHRAGRPLLLTGRLAATTDWAVRNATLADDRFQVAGLVFYAPYQFYGTRTIPARNPLGFSQKVLDGMEAILAEAVFIKLGG